MANEKTRARRRSSSFRLASVLASAGRPLALLLFCVATTPTQTSCGSGAQEDLASQLARYPELGRRAIDPPTPGIITPTFDDGPSEYTKEIVDILVRHRVKATFFVVGRLVAGKRDVLEYSQSKGMQVASHSYNHEAQPSLDEDVFKYRVRAVKQNIGDTDNGRLFFRFPFGAAGEDQLRWLSEVEIDGHHYRPVGWHADSHDFDFNQKYPAEELSDIVVTGEKLPDQGKCDGQDNPFQRDMIGWTEFIARKTQGGVVLFHDTKQITRDKLDEILTHFEEPERYWVNLKPERRAELQRYYACQHVDPMLRFTYRSLSDGAYPSLRD